MFMRLLKYICLIWVSHGIPFLRQNFVKGRQLFEAQMKWHHKKLSLYFWNYSVCMYSGRSTAFFFVKFKTFTVTEKRRYFAFLQHRKDNRAKGRLRDQIKLISKSLSVKHDSILRLYKQTNDSAKLSQGLFDFTYFVGLKSKKLLRASKGVPIAKYCFVIWILSNEWYSLDVMSVIFNLKKYSQRKAWKTPWKWFLRCPRGNLYRELKYDFLSIVRDNSNKQVCNTNSDKMDRLWKLRLDLRTGLNSLD